MAASTLLGGTPNLTAVHSALQADARLVEMQLQAQVSDKPELDGRSIRGFLEANSTLSS